MSIATFSVKISWSGYSDFSGTYDTITTDVLYARWGGGFKNPRARIAGKGFCHLILDDGARNNHGIYRLYTPDYSSGPLYGDLVPRRSIEIEAVSGAVTHTFRGLVRSITPGRNDTIIIKGDDGMSPLQTFLIDRFAMLFDATAEEGIQSVIDTTAFPILALEYWAAGVAGRSEAGVTTYAAPDGVGVVLDVGGETFPLIGDFGGRASSYDAIGDITMSAYGRFWCSLAGEYVFWDSSHEFEDNTPVATFSDVALNTEVDLDLDKIVSRTTSRITPRDIGSTNEVLFSRNDAVVINPGETISFVAKFRDADGGGDIAAQSIAALVSGTDYIANEKSDGSGTDYTFATSVSITEYAEAVEVDITNTHAYQPIYLTYFQVRGIAVRARDQVIIEVLETATEAKYQRRQLDLVFPFSNWIGKVKAIAEYEQAAAGTPQTDFGGFTLVNFNTSQYEDMLALEIMDLLTLTSTRDGISAEKHRAIYLEHEVEAGEHKLKVKTSRHHPIGAWLAGTAGYSEAGSTTIAGIG